MRLRVLAFARVAEVLGWNAREIDVDAATPARVFSRLCEQAPELRALAESTRFARNGRVVQGCEPLVDGDEMTLLPPVGGG